MFGQAEELHRKALDQISWLYASYEAETISGETFRVGVETIWNCLSGICDLPEFHALMRDANAEVRKIPKRPKVTVLRDESNLIVAVRNDEDVTVLMSKISAVRFNHFDIDDEARARVSQIRDRAIDKGYELVT